jgi:hypothetical protein
MERPGTVVDQDRVLLPRFRSWHGLPVRGQTRGDGGAVEVAAEGGSAPDFADRRLESVEAGAGEVGELARPERVELEGGFAALAQEGEPFLAGGFRFGGPAELEQRRAESVSPRACLFRVVVRREETAMLSPRLRLPPLTAANPPVQRRSGDPDLPDAAGRRAGCRAALVGLACATVLSALGGSAQALPIGFTGVSTVRSQGFENENLLFYVPATNDHFGAALATGDFNGDGADDLATGIPGDDGLAGFEVADMGIVVVRYGIGGFGLDPGLADAVITKNYGGAPTQAAANDHFGSALAAGDWNGDGYDDLAVGSPGDSYCHPDACLGGVGAVYLFYGTSAGLNLAPTWPIGYVNYFPQYGWGLGNHFGSVLASGNFNGDLYDDLAIASPYYDYDNFLNLTDAGGVWVVHGGPSGIGSDGFFITPQDAQIPDAAEPLESFGYSLAVGNFNGDTHSIGNEVYPYDDLAIGVPSEDDVGAVLVIYGSNFSLLYGSSQYFSEFDLGTGAMQAGAHFGHTLVAADFDGDSVDDLALASPHQDVGSGGLDRRRRTRDDRLR